jgi:VIT1/CCC1 family predicted Fe2+/Mn2+ transporter
MLDPELKKKVLAAQKNEATEQVIYHKLACCLKDKTQAGILEKISHDEGSHYDFWKALTGTEVKPDKVKVAFFVFLSRVFGLTFGLKLMENGEELAQDVYAKLAEISPGVKSIIDDEESHENQLIDLIGEEKLLYISSVVLGLNDALVELTGALVGFSLALQKTHLVAIVGSITGIAAALSMAASEYLSTKQEDTKKDPVRASIYTGITYIFTVALLVMPYMFLHNVYACIGLVLSVALLAIFVFTFYISVAKGLSFKTRFLEMAGISLGIAAINFLIGLAIRKWIGVDV